jgi:N6-L-threonylcarbamoyladenine synthase
MAAAFQEAAVDVMVNKALKAVERYNAKGLLLGGGVAANTRLREEATRLSPVPVLVPSPRLCTDNGAMIAAAAYFRFQRGESHGLGLDAIPTLSMV